MKPWSKALAAAALVAAASAAAWLWTGPGRKLARDAGLAPATMIERHAADTAAASFDHAAFDRVLRRHVDAHGWVDYGALRADTAELDAYVRSLSTAPFAALGRDGKLALLINAYNAFTLALVVEHYPLGSIMDIPAADRWEARRWVVGGRRLSLDEIEHEAIRRNFREPRIHFALVCAAVGCPVLRNEPYEAARLEAQLADQAAYTHANARWLRFDAEAGDLLLTRLYDWYREDFETVAGSVPAYVARFSTPVRRAVEAGRSVEIGYLDYDWRLNDIGNAPQRP